MATSEAGHSADQHAGDAHGHDHDHPDYLAHHFDTPEQQFDSGKLGMWLFLVTEVLFFSGMFCAYAIFRAWRPEVFEGCSQFLNTKLGAINTGVLLFSSFTMAWAVRTSQLEEHKKTAALIATTLCCAMVFLGVKAVEYSHKWTMGLLPAGLFSYDENNPHPTGGPDWLLYICMPFIAITVGVFLWMVFSWQSKSKFQFECAKPLFIVCLSFFGGVYLGTVLEPKVEDHAAHASVDGHHVGDAAHAGDAEHGEDEEHAAGAAEGDHEDGEEAAEPAATTEPDEEAEKEEAAPEIELGSVVPKSGTMVDSSNDLLIQRKLASVESNAAIRDELTALERQDMNASGAITYNQTDDTSNTIAGSEEDVMRRSRAGVFFSIYYCMTGVHAIHILAGIGVLVWLLVRALRKDFNRNYFGPVDYVGLYWHLVDLIWIYLFPLMYLIR